MDSLALLNRRDLLRTLGATSLACWWPLGSSADGTGEPGEFRKQLRVQSELPFNAEPAADRLLAGSITPLEHFYVRNHGPTPKLDVQEFRLTVEGLVHRPLTLNLAELQQRFRKHSLEATLTCAGNRRSEMNALQKVAGVPWDAGAIGNALWEGALLADLLRAAEIKPGAKHVWFEGADPVKEKDGSVAPFGASIPLEKALAGDQPGTLLASSMNGQPLLAEHGFPFRTVVPGYIGARSVKWLSKIVVSDRSSPNHYVADAYKLVQNDSADERAAASPIYEYLVNGAICLPTTRATLKAGKVRVAGYALPSGDSGSTVQRVSVSADRGQTWQDARLDGDAKPFCWQLWTADITITSATRHLIVRVRDSRGHEQPEVGSWNLKGYLFNGWYHCPITVEA